MSVVPKVTRVAAGAIRGIGAVIDNRHLETKFGKHTVAMVVSFQDNCQDKYQIIIICH